MCLYSTLCALAKQAEKLLYSFQRAPEEGKRISDLSQVLAGSVLNGCLMNGALLDSYRFMTYMLFTYSTS